MKIERLHIIACLAIAALAWWVVLLVQNTPVKLAHAAPFTVVVTVLGLLAFVFDRYLWRSQFLHGWFFKRPDLRGTWRVELQSSYIDPATKQSVPMIVCYMGIEQTLSDLKMHLMTPESESWSIASHIIQSPSGNGYQAICVYTNDPNIHLRDKGTSHTHKGTIIVDTHGSGVRPDTLTAQYWTDRKTMGTMDFTKRVSPVFTRFGDADQQFKKLNMLSDSSYS